MADNGQMQQKRLNKQTKNALESHRLEIVKIDNQWIKMSKSLDILISL